ncbi:MAG TPA: PAS domain-containing protein, partial [Aquabacterium sp.]|nr:PAS domain-containing protein [Aquabacterium sp.]
MIYLIMAGLWIWGSDWVALQWLGSPEAVTRAQTWKGLLFVGLTASLLVTLIRREERAQAHIQAELTQTRDQLTHIVDVSATMIYALTQQQGEWRVSYVSSNIERLTGHALTHWLEPEFWLQHVHPDDRERVREARPRLLLQGELRHQYRILHGEGQYRWVDDQLTLLRDPEGHPVEIIGSWRDITQEAQTQAALRERQIQLDTFATHAPASLAMFDRDMRYILASQRWIHDFHPEDTEVVGRLSAVLMPEQPPAWPDAHRRAFAGEVVRNDEDHFVQRDGTERWLRWEVRPCNTVAGTVDSIAVFC